MKFITIAYNDNFITITIKISSDVKYLFTDTESLVYEIKTDNIYKNFYEDRNLFYFSDYAKDSKFCNSVN